MKGLNSKRNVVVPLKERSDVRPSNEPPLAEQIAHMDRICEKLLYRIQNLERREKSTRNVIGNLRREVRSLKQGRPTDAHHADEAVTSLLPTREELLHPTTSSLPPRKIRPLSEPDFSGSPTDLNIDRH